MRNVRVFTRYWLALIGEWPWEKTPNLPPEVIWFPLWFPFSIYNFAQWARATLMPIALLSARRPSRPLPPENRLDALFPGGREAFDYELPKKADAGGWDGFFRGADKVLHALQELGAQARRWRCGAGAAIAAHAEWIVEPSGRRRRLGRHPAAVDLQPDGAARRRLRARPSRDGQGARRAQRSRLALGRGRGDLHPGHQLARSGTRCWRCSPSRTPGFRGEYPQGDREGGAMAAVAPGARSLAIGA